MIKNIDINFDYNHIWHPYSTIIKPIPCYPVKKTKNIYIKLYNKKNLIDGMSSWWSTIYGYNNKRINITLKKQTKKLNHVMFGGLTHKPAISFCKELIKITRNKFKYIFLSDSGSTSIEVAIKMTIQYWKNKKKKRNLFLTFLNGYHGDTLGAKLISDPYNNLYKDNKNFIPIQIFSNLKNCNFYQKWKKKSINITKKLIKKYYNKIVAIIIEPIIQSAGGMIFYHPRFITELYKICKKNKILLILDEIATGFGKTGKTFSYFYSKIKPDIICLGKSITGGVLSLGATLIKNKIAKLISKGNTKCLMYGPTFMANPLSCIIAKENLKKFKKNKWKKKVLKIERIIYYYLKLYKNHKRIFNIRIIGSICVIECNQYINISIIQKFFIKKKIWIRPFKKLIYLTLSYIIKANKIKKLIKYILLSLNYDNFFLN